MPLDITDTQRAEIEQALRDDYFEGAIELVFQAFPDITRDEAVDIVQDIEAEMKVRKSEATWGGYPLTWGDEG